jgi:ELWxxDGT repeat protein
MYFLSPRLFSSNRFPFIAILTALLCLPQLSAAQEELVSESFSNPVGASEYLYKMEYQDEELVFFDDNTYHNGEQLHRMLPEGEAINIDYVPGTQYVEYNGNLIFSNGTSLIEYDGTSFRDLEDNEGFSSSEMTDISYLAVYDNGTEKKLYFSAKLEKGAKLWSYDGKTFHKEEIFGSDSDIYSTNPQDLTVLNKETEPKLCFTAEDKNYNWDIYCYDGSTLTKLDEQTSYEVTDPTELISYNDGSTTKLYFAGSKNDGDESLLFSYDGSALDIETDIITSEYREGFNLKKFDLGSGTKLFFTGEAETTNNGLISFDGKEASVVADMAWGNLFGYNQKIYFTSEDEEHGRELGVYDGSTAKIAADINSGSDDSYPSNFAIYNDGSATKLVFRTTDGIIASYDGETVTELVTDLPENTATYSEALVTAKNLLFFYSAEGQYTDYSDLAVYDGQTAEYFDTTENNQFYGVAATDKIVYDGVLYFAASNYADGEELWSYDGNKIEQVADLYTNDNYGSDPDNFFVYDDGGGKDLYISTTYSYYRYDGENFEELPDIRPEEYTVYKDNLYFTASSEDAGTELWMYDGSEFAMVKDLHPGEDGSEIDDITLFDDGSGTKMYFPANADNDAGTELWSYDGESFSMVENIREGGYSSSPSHLTVFDAGSGPKLYFEVSRSYDSNRPEIMVYDGSEIKDIPNNGDQDWEEPEHFYLHDNGSATELFFSAESNEKGRELFRYDGEEVTLISDIAAGEANSNPQNFTTFNNQLYFTAETETEGREPYVYNGQGISSYSINKGNRSGYGTYPTIYNDGTGKELYVRGKNGINGFELYRFGPEDKPFSSTNTSNEEITHSQPNSIRLKANYPNPFNPTTNISFKLPQATHVEITIYDMLGREISTLVNGRRSAGQHTITFDASSLATGMYIYQLSTEESVKTKKMMLIK